MKRRPAGFPYFLKRRLRKIDPSGTPKRRIKPLHFFEVLGIIIAIAAVYIAYQEYKTGTIIASVTSEEYKMVRSERLTPYRSVVFTAQFETYRELVRLRSEFKEALGTVSYLYGMETIRAAHRNPALIGTPFPPRNTVRIPECRGASAGAQEVDQHVVNLSVALWSAGAVWSAEVSSAIQQAQPDLERLRIYGQAVRLRERSLVDHPWNLADCDDLAGHLKTNLETLVAKLDSITGSMRRALRVDSMNMLPRE